MTTHIPPPVVYNGTDFSSPTDPNFTGFGTVPGAYVVDPLLTGQQQSYRIENGATLGTYYCVLWGAGGTGGASVSGNPAGDLIGGAGGAGLAYQVTIQLNVTQQGAIVIPPSCSITFSLVGGNGAITFTDTGATLVVGGVDTATKTIVALPAQGGSAATYSFSLHATGAGGAGGGQIFGQNPTPITIADGPASTQFLLPPSGFQAWNFNLTNWFTSIRVTPVLGGNGVNGIQGAVSTPPCTYTLPVNAQATTPPTTLQLASSGALGLSSGSGGAGCGSVPVATPGAGSTGFVWVHAH